MYRLTVSGAKVTEQKTRVNSLITHTPWWTTQTMGYWGVWVMREQFRCKFGFGSCPKLQGMGSCWNYVSIPHLFLMFFFYLIFHLDCCLDQSYIIKFVFRVKVFIYMSQLTYQELRREYIVFLLLLLALIITQLLSIVLGTLL